MLIRTLALAGLASIVPATSALAAVTTTYHGIFTVNTIGNVSSSSIAVGDQYYFEFTVDPMAQDQESSTEDAYFTSVLTAFKMGKVSGSGTFDPSSFNMSSYAYTTQTGNLLVGASGTATPGLTYTNWQGNATLATYFGFELYLAETWDDQGSPFFYQMFSELNPSSTSAKILVDNTAVNLTGTSFQPGEYVAGVPEASSSLLFLGSVAIGVLRRKRKA